jgi:predicted DNA-binding transcriptional regulator YafY
VKRASPGAVCWSRRKALKSATAFSATQFMEPERSRTKTSSVSIWFITFHSGTHGRGTADLRIFQSVSQAVWRAEELEFDYRKVSAKAAQGAERRRVQGLHLGCFDNQWYLFAQDLVRGAIRTFVLGRMERVKNTGKRFKRPPGFSLDGLLAGSFGVFSAPRAEQLRLRFDAFASRLVRERVWHPTQCLRNLPADALELTLEVGVSPEVKRWLIGWGEHVEVLAPAALRLWMEQTALKMASRHAGAPREFCDVASNDSSSSAR